LLQASVGVVVAGAVWQRDCVRRKEKKGDGGGEGGRAEGKETRSGRDSANRAKGA